MLVWRERLFPWVLTGVQRWNPLPLHPWATEPMFPSPRSPFSCLQSCFSQIFASAAQRKVMISDCCSVRFWMGILGLSALIFWDSQIVCLKETVRALEMVLYLIPCTAQRQQNLLAPASPLSLSGKVWELCQGILLWRIWGFNCTICFSPQLMFAWRVLNCKRSWTAQIWSHAHKQGLRELGSGLSHCSTSLDGSSWRAGHRLRVLKVLPPVQSTLRSPLKHLETEQAWEGCCGGAGAFSSTSFGMFRCVWCENGRKCSIF